MNAQIDHFLSARGQARRLAAQQENQLVFARRFLAGLLTAYLPSLGAPPVKPLSHALATKMGFLARSLDMEMAAYLIGATYTVMLPDEYRGEYGVFYTPPALVERLFDLAEQAGVDWFSAWVSQIFAEIMLEDDIVATGRPLSKLVQVMCGNRRPSQQRDS